MSYKPTLRFNTYKRATNTPRRFGWHWNEYREVLRPDGVGIRIGAAVQIGMRVFGVRWKERVRRG